MRKLKKLISAVTASIMTLSIAASMAVPVSAVDLSAVDLVEDMGLGWNLGNTLDSIVGWEDEPSPTTVETGWGNTVTTEAMIKEIKNSGFNTVRVPVTWTQGRGDIDYTQNADFVARVKEVVDYVIKNDMYCIINMHHDENWIQEDTAEGKAKFENDWKAIAEAFKDYDQHLVFEGTNECNFKNDSTQMTYNQLFVDTVRASGGNNTNRLCLVPANTNNTSKALSDSFSAPSDSSNMVAVSVHYYEPPQFCIAEANASWGHSETWGSDSEVSAVANDFNKLKMKFIDNGIPVIIGEYGVCNADKYGGTTAYNKDVDSIRKFVKTVASTAYNMKGICPVAWDDSNSGTVYFFNRKELSWWDSEIATIFKQVSEGKVSSSTTFENTKEVTVKFSDLTADKDGNYRIDLTPYAGQGATITSAVLKGTATGDGVGYGFGFEAYRDGASTATWSSETGVLTSSGETVIEFDGKSSDENGDYSYELSLNYLQIQQWWTNSDDATASLDSITFVFDKEISVANSSGDNTDTTEPSSEAPTESTEPSEEPTTETPSDPVSDGYTFTMHGQYGGSDFWDDTYSIPVDKSGTYTINIDKVGETKKGDLALFLDSDVNVYDFKVNEDSTGIKDGTLNITVDSIKVDGTEVAYTYEEGALTTMDDGKSLRLNIVNPWSNPVIEGIDPAITVTEGISVTFTVQLGAEEVKEPTYGDVNGDGSVDVVDVLLLNKYLLGVANLDAQARANADVNKDGAIADNDAMNILKSVVKLVELPIA